MRTTGMPMPMLSPAARAALAVWLAQAPLAPEGADDDGELCARMANAAAANRYQSQGEAVLHQRLKSTTSGR